MGYPIFHSQYTAAQIEAAIGKGPRVNASGFWEVWNVSTGAYESTGVGAGVTPPTVVTQVSQMTNHGYIYIYNGTETGYTAGYWYYWNGSAWAAGGAYQVAATDTTLTVAGAAADAEATGDKLGELKSAFEWQTLGKNLCGLNPDVMYRVFLRTGDVLTMSTETGQAHGFSGLYLYLYDKDGVQLNYYTFPANASERTVDINISQDAYYMRWSRNIGVGLQVEIGSAKTEYEEYWGNPVHLHQMHETLAQNLDGLLGKNNLIGKIDDRTYLQASTCRVFPNTDGYRASDYIKITGGNSYIVGVFNDSYAPSVELSAITICFYGATQNGLPAYSAYSSGYEHTNCTWENGCVKVTAPDEAVYMRVGVNDFVHPFNWGVFDYTESPLYSAPEKISDKASTIYTGIQGKKIACFGDSVIGNTRDYTSVPAFISKECGATVYNFGFGGCRMSVHSGDWDNCSMYRLANDIYNNDFSSLVAAINTGWSGMPGYFKNTAALIAACDFSTLDAIVISYGTNDYREPTSILDNPNDKFDTTTVCGALRYSIKQILSKYPTIQILVTCPIFRTFFAEGTTTPKEYSDTKDWGSGTLLQYAEAYKQACADMNVPFLDLYHTTCFNPYSRLGFYPVDDGTHPNENGRKRLGVLIAGKLQEIV